MAGMAGDGQRGGRKGRTGKEGAYMVKKPEKKSATQIEAMCV